MERQLVQMVLCVRAEAVERLEMRYNVNNPKGNILVVDDDYEIADLVEIHLVSDGYKVFKANDGKEALDIFQKEKIDLAILDIMMPKMDGNEVCARIRETSTIPIIMLSAKDTEIDKITGLGNGADDYVTKPFNTLELVARVKSQLRRYQNFGGSSEGKNSTTVQLENLYIDKTTHIVRAYGKNIKLTPLEFEILYLLASHPNQVFSTDEIFENVWKEKSFEMSNTVMVHIRRLREKIEIDARKAQIIKTVWGVGYKIEA